MDGYPTASSSRPEAGDEEATGEETESSAKTEGKSKSSRHAKEEKYRTEDEKRVVDENTKRFAEMEGYMSSHDKNWVEKFKSTELFSDRPVLTQADDWSWRESVKEINPADLDLAEKVGTGCTAEVFRAVYKEVDDQGNVQEKIVAVKQIEWNKKNMGEKEQRAFDREVAIMPRLQHPNLVAFLGVCSIEKPFRIITELCAGGCCFELLHNCDDVDLRWPQQFKICNDVAKAMNYLHSFTPQIIHRDLKSLNLLLTDKVLDCYTEPLVKISDFGLSRMKDAGAENDWTNLTVAAGTCHWMAPEVYQGSSYDEKVDVYSFAMIIFEVVCREIPFEEEEPAQVGNMTIRGERPDLEALPPDCPRLLKDLMIQSWAPDAKRRPPFSDIIKYLHLAEHGRLPPS